MYSLLVPLMMMMALSVEVYSNKIIVPDSIPTIQDAIEKANKGDTVFVRIGKWKENITLRDSIILIGESISETILQGKKNQPVVKGANGAIIKKVTVTGGRVGILCENTEMTIEEVIVKGNKESGIHCLISLPNIYNSIIYRNKTNGIFCEGTRSLRTSIIHNIIAENGSCGIMLSGHSEVLIKNNVIMGNKQYG
ncbi:MAG: right-handed parallel beta-helix repeat-containing protein, partial [Chitinispirillaceae bacterium]|nr:right-handed parallel beta-helix repeat-containing protein [Chitinispirillaceae bacterium]